MAPEGLPGDDRAGHVVGPPDHPARHVIALTARDDAPDGAARDQRQLRPARGSGSARASSRCRGAAR